MQEFSEFPIEESLSDKLAWLEFHFEALNQTQTAMDSVSCNPFTEVLSSSLEVKVT